MPEPAATPQSTSDETGGLSILECAVIGLALGGALYVGWSAYQQWRAERASRQILDGAPIDVQSVQVAQNGHVGAVAEPAAFTPPPSAQPAGETP